MDAIYGGSAAPVNVVGAAVNAEEGGGEVTLSIGAASDGLEKKDSTLYEKNLQFSMGLDGAEFDDAGELAVPVVVSIPVPDYYRPGKAVVTHHSDSQDERMDANITTSGGAVYANLVVTNFNDFTISQEMMAAERSNGAIDISSIFAGVDLEGCRNVIYSIYDTDGRMVADELTTVDNFVEELSLACDLNHAATVGIFRLNEFFCPVGEKVTLEVR